LSRTPLLLSSASTCCLEARLVERDAATSAVVQETIAFVLKQAFRGELLEQHRQLYCAVLARSRASFVNDVFALIAADGDAALSSVYSQVIADVLTGEAINIWQRGAQRWPSVGTTPQMSLSACLLLVTPPVREQLLALVDWLLSRSKPDPQRVVDAVAADVVNLLVDTALRGGGANDSSIGPRVAVRLFLLAPRSDKFSPVGLAQFARCLPNFSIDPWLPQLLESPDLVPGFSEAFVKALCKNFELDLAPLATNTHLRGLLKAVPFPRLAAQTTSYPKTRSAIIAASSDLIAAVAIAQTRVNGTTSLSCAIRVLLATIDYSDECRQALIDLDMRVSAGVRADAEKNVAAALDANMLRLIRDEARCAADDDAISVKLLTKAGNDVVDLKVPEDERLARVVNQPELKSMVVVAEGGSDAKQGLVHTRTTQLNLMKILHCERSPTPTLLEG